MMHIQHILEAARQYATAYPPTDEGVRVALYHSHLVHLVNQALKGATGAGRRGDQTAQ